MINDTATVIIVAKIIMRIVPPSPPPPPRSHQAYLDMLSDIFRRYDWRAKACPSFGPDTRSGLLVSRDDSRYIVELKISSEGRRDRLVPLLAQAILEAKSVAHASPEPVVPLAVIAAPVISPSVPRARQTFLAEVAPDAAMGMFDREGFRHFVGPGLEPLNAPAPSRRRRKHQTPPSSAPLISVLHNASKFAALRGQFPNEFGPAGECGPVVRRGTGRSRGVDGDDQALSVHLHGGDGGHVPGGLLHPRFEAAALFRHFQPTWIVTIPDGDGHIPAADKRVTRALRQGRKQGRGRDDR